MFIKTAFRFFLGVFLLLDISTIQDCPHQPTVPFKTPPLSAKEIKYAKTIAKKSENWLKGKRIAKRSTLQYRELQVIPKHLINDRGPGYAHIRRKEYRHMSLEELNTFHRCLQEIKDRGDYDMLADLHHPELAKAAHFGVAFLPWHRQYLLIFEEIIRGYEGCETFFTPYWDASLDEMLPEPTDSSLWTADFWGTVDGSVTTGNLGNSWHITPKCVDMELPATLARHADRKRKHIYSKQRILDLFAANSYTEMLLRDDTVGMFSQFELAHGFMHCFIGTCVGHDDMCRGHFGCLRCSANDPIFWLLHTFVDYLWDEWSSMPDKENKYPEIGMYNATYYSIGELEHMKDSPMSPFPGLKNIDGFRKNYYPGYHPRPSLLHCRSDQDCQSDSNQLHCHNCGFCVAKIRESGNCTGMHHNACYCQPYQKPLCLDNICYCF